MERLSTQTQESGFVSMHSQRSSAQSYTASSITSKRSSQQSSISYNSQTFNSQQSFSQTKLSSDSIGSIFTQKTMTSSKSNVSATNISGSGDPAMLEKLVNVGVACCVALFYFSSSSINRTETLTTIMRYLPYISSFQIKQLLHGESLLYFLYAFQSD